MSAEVLRRAAALMRERAEAAEQGVWTALVDAVYVNPEFNDQGWLYYDATIVEAVESEDPTPAANLEHIASWHPAVALAVAKWLEIEAEQFGGSEYRSAALAVATTYLGADA